MTELRTFLMQYIDTPMQWGRDDCSLILADWWLANHGTDPAAHLRGTYATADGKAAIVAAAGGLVPLVAGIADAAGAEESAGNEDGSIAVIRDREVGYVSGIRSGRFWAVRSDTGIAFVSDVKVIKAWAV